MVEKKCAIRLNKGKCHDIMLSLLYLHILHLKTLSQGVASMCIS